MKIPFGRPMLGQEEQDAVKEVLDSGILVHGHVAGQFETDFARFCGAPQAVTVSSCTAGMHLFYFAMGIGVGDEVIVPAQTHVATAHAVTLTGATPVFVDSEPLSGNIDVSAIEAAITPQTRAISLVHYLGVPVDMIQVMAIAAKYHVLVLEDCALAIGAKVAGKHVGLHGDVGVFSFYPVKHLTTGEGGMIVLKDKLLADRLRLLRAFGVDRTHLNRSIPGQYDTVALGFNYRMSELHAAIGREQIKKLKGMCKRRRDNHEVLSELLSEVNSWKVLAQPIDGYLESSHYCCAVLLSRKLIPQRAKIMNEMAERGIGTSIYYPRPVPEMSFYKETFGYDVGHFPVAKNISDSGIALPVGPHLDSDDMETIATTLADVVGCL